MKYKTMTEAWHWHVRQLVDGKRALIAAKFEIENTRQAWVGGGRSSEYSLGLGFLDLITAIENSGSALSQVCGRYKDIKLRVVLQNDTLHLVATSGDDMHINSQAIYSYFVLNQLALILAALYKMKYARLHCFSALMILPEVQVFPMSETLLDDPNGSEWISPPILKEEAEDLFLQTSVLRQALRTLKTNDILAALSFIPSKYAWCTTALKAIHYCQMKGIK